MGIFYPKILHLLAKMFWPKNFQQTSDSFKFQRKQFSLPLCRDVSELVILQY